MIYVYITRDTFVWCNLNDWYANYLKLPPDNVIVKPTTPMHDVRRGEYISLRGSHYDNWYRKMV